MRELGSKLTGQIHLVQEALPCIREKGSSSMSVA
jgi:hypothetical protein